MNVMLISQCNKKALVETRRIIDQFAERRGDRTWQTPITQIGLTTLRKLLRKKARRNTAVACHWIRSKNHTELLWVVGNASKFNEEGAVPTNITRRDVLKSSEDLWHTAEDIALLAGLAALFHDFGKANVLFQKKLAKSKEKLYEPYRHEWVSLRMFEAFVNGQSDEKWLTRLSNVNKEDNRFILDNIIKDHPNQKYINPFNPGNDKKLPPMARAVAWLILTHHKLPQYKGDNTAEPDMDYGEEVLDYELTPAWNSPQIFDSNEYSDDTKAKKWTTKELEGVWNFKDQTPVLSTTWRSKAQRLAKRALNRRQFTGTKWLDDTYSLHLSRMALMLADHHYSSLEANESFQDKKYKVHANTNRETGEKNQKLDEHLIGVYRNSLQLVRLLPSLKSGLSSITRHRKLRKRTSNKRFSWQDKAYDIARSISEQTEHYGFFGINMASTGMGKTFANARIMYGLANPKVGCRFSIALGLRTLTLQTGTALRERLRLEDDELAVLIGSQAVKELHELAQRQAKELKVKNDGSESQNSLLDEDQHVLYEGTTSGPLKHWLEKKDKLNKMVCAPVLVSTIDHIMPATESDRGGKQIAPMLRLLTADLVLDEIDDFDLADLPAICRLVNWAGLLGSRVLLSSATLPPALVATLFDAYLKGRAEYQKARGIPGLPLQVCCAWFDEFNASAEVVDSKAAIQKHHSTFVDKRIDKLTAAIPARQAELIPVTLADAAPVNADNVKVQNKLAAASALANKIYQSINTLHNQHAITNDITGQRLSIGLVRMANIDPMVAVAKNLFTTEAASDTQIHYCVYHSRHPLVIRSAIEAQLDKALKRDDESAIWQNESIKQALAKSKATNHIFVVLGSPVCEVGRDHDYDWAVVEPSSMRSIIQLAGRVLRHRNKQPKAANIHILEQNNQALIGSNIVFTKPGFETANDKLATHQLAQLLLPQQYKTISSIDRIKQPQLNISSPAQNLVAFEHNQLDKKLSSGDKPASLWWQKPLSWSYEWQRQTRFRKSQPTDDFVLKIDEDEQTIVIHQWAKSGELKNQDHKFKRTYEVAGLMASGISLWGKFDYLQQIEELAELLDKSIDDTCIGFGSISLAEITPDSVWLYEECLGFYRGS